MARILIVDDDNDFRAAMATVLRDEGHDIEEVGDGYRALTAVVRTRPDLIVTDHCMPPPDGLRLLKMLRTQGIAIPAILVSANPVADPRPADAWLRKPFEMDELIAAVQGLVGSA
jgi:CheY-like chemotaxis protein